MVMSAGRRGGNQFVRRRTHWPTCRVSVYRRPIGGARDRRPRSSRVPSRSLLCFLASGHGRRRSRGKGSRSLTRCDGAIYAPPCTPATFLRLLKGNLLSENAPGLWKQGGEGRSVTLCSSWVADTFGAVNLWDNKFLRCCR